MVQRDRFVNTVNHQQHIYFENAKINQDESTIINHQYTPGTILQNLVQPDRFANNVWKTIVKTHLVSKSTHRPKSINSDEKSMKHLTNLELFL